ncbi:MAG: FdtA/QdtA family cupin domain-containing protein [Bacilli bacterium]
MIDNCKLIEFKKMGDVRGELVAIEYPKNLDFEIKRIYYIFDVNKGIERGFHSHENLEQVLIALNGSIKIRTSNPFEEKIVELKDPNIGLYIGPMVWREMFDFSEGAVLLVIASHEYDEKDYIKDKIKYIEKYKQKYGEVKNG